MSWRLFKKIIRWVLLIVILMYAITGFGITEFRTVEAVTFGLLTKPLSFKMHDYLIYPMAVLLFLHVVLPIMLKHAKRNRIQADVPRKRAVKLIK